MSTRRSPQSVRVYDLVGREIRDAGGKKLGRVRDLQAEHRGGKLCVTGLVVGRQGWLERFGWTDRPARDIVRWEDIKRWDPHIVLRRGAGVQDSASN